MFVSLYILLRCDITLIVVDVVELNPFAEFAGGGLFSWVDDLSIFSCVNVNVTGVLCCSDMTLSCLCFFIIQH